MKTRNIILSIVTSLLIFFTANAQQVDVQLFIAPPYSNKLDDYLRFEEASILTLTNFYEEAKSINLQIELYRSGRLFAATRPEFKIASPLVLGSMETSLYSGSDLSNLFTGVNMSVIDHNLTEQQFNTLKLYKILPEGFYQLCIIPYDYNTNERLSPSAGGTGCFSFYLQDGIPAEIIVPFDNESLVNLDNGISWSPAISHVTQNLEYTLEIRDITNIPLPKEDVKKMANLLIFSTTIHNDVFYPYNFDGSDPVLQKGHTYQIDLISKDLDYQISFQNEGYGESKRFSIIDTLPSSPGSITLEAIYPTNGDTLPFSYISSFVKYTPYAEAYKEYDATYTINGNGKSHTYNSVQSWPRGALFSLQQTYPEVTENEAQHVVVNHKKQQESNLGKLKKDGNYQWSVVSKMKKDRGWVNLNPVNGNFKHGMTKPVLKNPPQNEKYYSLMDINFKWKTGTVPSNPLPPFKGFRNKSHDIVVQEYLGPVEEVWAFQLATNPNFKSPNLIHCKAGKIDYNPESEKTLEYSVDKLKSKVYKEIVHKVQNLDFNTYYWRVVYLKDPSIYNTIATKDTFEIKDNKFYRSSAVHQFEIIDNSNNNGVSSNCGGGCELPEFIDDNYGLFPINDLSGIDELKISTFRISNLKKVTSAGNDAFNAEGELLIPFLNNIKVKVKLNHIKVNSQKQIFEGSVEAFSSTMTPSVDLAKSAWDKIKLVKDMVSGGGEAHEIPLGIDYDITGTNLKVGITKIKMTVGKINQKISITGKMDLMTYVEVPGYTHGWINMAATDICFNENGIGSEFLLHPLNDIDLTAGGVDGFQVLIKGYDGNLNGVSGDARQNILNKASYIEFDCKGWKSFALRGAVKFPQEYLLLDIRETGKVDTTRKVTGSFTVQFDKNNADPNGATLDNWVASINMDPFQVKGLKGWGFHITEAYFDNSDLVNPTGIVFPQGYVHPAISNSNTTNTWKGIYLKKASILLPKELLGSSARTELSLIENMIIDHSGKFTAFIGIHDLIAYDTGEMGGWAFSLDKVGIQILQNELTSGNLEGKIGLPLTHKEEYLAYAAILAKKANSEDYAFTFNIKPEDQINLELFAAYAKLDNNTVFQIEYDNDTKVSAELYGVMSLGSKNINKNINIPGFKMPGIKFELTYDNKEGFTHDEWSYASPQKKIQGFPITIEDVSLEAKKDNVKLNITPKISLAGGKEAFSASSKFAIEASYNIGDKHFSLDDVTLESINIDTEFSGFKLKGGLEWYDETSSQNTNLKGVRGELDVTIPIGVEVALSSDFGNYENKNVADPIHGSSDYYTYFYLDGMVSFPGMGVPLSAGFNLNALGGGFGYNMQLDNEDYYKQTNLVQSMEDLKKAPPNNSTKKQKSKSKYIPHFESHILKFACKAGLQHTYNVFSALTISFNTHNGLGLNEIIFLGNAIFLPSSNQGPNIGNNYIAGEAKINYNHHTEVFHAEFNVYADILNGLIQGSGGDKENSPFKHRVIRSIFHFAPEAWYVHIGTYQERAGLKMDLKILTVEITSYMMFGYNIPTYLPPLPSKLTSVLGINNEGKGEEAGSSFKSATDTRQASEIRGGPYNTNIYNSGKGFAFGAAGELNYKLDAGIVYAKLSAILGFDINITQSNDRFCYDESGTQNLVGKDGWYGQGQVYAGLFGNLGIRIWFFGTHEIDILTLSAAVALRGGLPNPNWFEGRAGVSYSVMGGLFSGNARFQVQIGEKCEIVSTNPFGMTFIEEISPQGKEVSILNDIKVIFTLPVNRVYNIPVHSEEEGKAPTIRKIAPIIYEYTVFKKGDENEVVAHQRYMEDDNMIARYEPLEYLDANTEYVVKIVLRGKECMSPSCSVNNIDSWNYVTINEKSNIIYEEIKMDTLKTGNFPRTLDDFVDFSWPRKNQHFFTYDDEFNKTFWLYYRSESHTKSFNKNSYHYYFPDKDDEGEPYYYIAQFIPMKSDRNSIEIPIAKSDIKRDHLTFIRNVDLAPNTSYELNILRLIKDKNVVKGNLNTPDKQLIGAKSIKGKDVSAKLEMHHRVLAQKNLQNSGQTIGNIGDLKLNPALIGNTYDQIPMPDYNHYYYTRNILYQYHFSTSKYHTLAEKVGAMEMTAIPRIQGGCTYLECANGSESCFGVDYQDVDIYLKGDEPFDIYDLFGGEAKFMAWPGSSLIPEDVLDYKFTPNVILYDPDCNAAPYEPHQTAAGQPIYNHRIIPGEVHEGVITYPNTGITPPVIDATNLSLGNSLQVGNPIFNGTPQFNNNNKNIVLHLNYYPHHGPTQGANRRKHADPYQQPPEEKQKRFHSLNNYPGYYKMAFALPPKSFEPGKSIHPNYAALPTSSEDKAHLEYPIYRRYMKEPYRIDPKIIPVWSMSELLEAEREASNLLHIDFEPNINVIIPGGGLIIPGIDLFGHGTGLFGNNMKGGNTGGSQNTLFGRMIRMMGGY
ncbi:MAG: hypothetical protein CSA95_06565 [Bacteroidetes bacterium]|nr:MAG: hypothetical protein CSA95_06565 [Bacteroidota bacterium]PIE87936.1 MAG: hypothetical protein CSA04_04465 [Bacteroidota bacterium]